MKIWVDIASGTYGLADNIVFVDIDGWSDQEIVNFDSMSDDDRSAFAFEFSKLQGEKE
jgi:hypothetical protein